jgi:Domain of unknown function (DUF4410)
MANGARLTKMIAGIVFVLLAAVLAEHLAGNAQAGQADPADAKKIPIYISDFELFSSATAPPHPMQKTGAGTEKPEDSIYADSDPASIQARRVMDFFSTTLVEMFQRNGYTASRLTGSQPTSGVLLRGVFAEPDGMNRIRRALLGGGSTGAKYTLYVASFNLTHQDQPLYLEAPVQAPDSHYGPVITLNTYVPMVKYELDKNPTPDDARKVCEQIVGQLTALLEKNPNAFGN